MKSKTLFTKFDTLLFSSILFLIILLYGPAFDAGFVTDFTGLYEKMQDKSIIDALGSFGFPSLMPLLNLMYFGLYELFQLNSFAWFGLFSICYSVGIIFFYKSCLMLLSIFDVKESKTISLLAIALIIVSPYQVEAMIWKVGLGHIMSVSLICIAGYHLLSYLEMKRYQSILWMVFYHFLSLVCFEWALVFPLMVGIILLLSNRFKTHWASLAASMTIVFIYLIVTKGIFGTWVGHYSIENDRLIDINQNMITQFKYFLKHVFLTPFCPSSIKRFIYGLAESPIVRIFIISSFSIRGYFLYKINKERFRLVLLCFLLCLISIILVSPLFFHELQWSENDRYGSLLVPFLSLTMLLAIWHFPKWLKFLIIPIYLFFNIFFQNKLVQNWAYSNDVIESLTESFLPFKDEKTLILNLPENYKGAFMFRDFYSDNPFDDHLKMKGIDFNEMEVVCQYNISSTTQSFFVKWVDKDTIRLESTEWGSWWWRHGIGLKEYTTEKFEVRKSAKYIDVILTSKADFDRYLYFDGIQFRSIRFTL